VCFPPRSRVLPASFPCSSDTLGSMDISFIAISSGLQRLIATLERVSTIKKLVLMAHGQYVSVPSRQKGGATVC
jgi:hypothetical protein